MMEAMEAITKRHSTRAFSDKSVKKELIERILKAASCSPSGVNTQPWKVCVTQGETRQQITDALLKARANNLPPDPDYEYYPAEWREPFRSRRIACGKSLYSALEISKEDKDRQLKAWSNNYLFFGAPVGLFFFIDRDLNQGSWLDYGMFLQNLMIAATSLGLATCPQASLAEYPDIIREILGVENQFALICGISLGYEDSDHPVNQYRLPREPVSSFCHWYN